MPDYSRYLIRVRQMTDNGLDAEEADWVIEQGYTLARRTIRNLIPAITPSLAALSNRQIAHLESHLAEINRDYREEYLPVSMEEHRARRARRTVDRIEHWTGKLRPDQVLLAGRLRDQFPNSAEDWLSYNIDRQHAFLNLLRGQPGAAAVERFLVDWWVELKGRTPILETMNQATLEGIKHMIVSVAATLDEDQRRHLRWRLDGYIDQIEILRRQRK